jgi:uncharacterized membrane-anchored protein YjiN (DUF445 family)
VTTTTTTPDGAAPPVGDEAGRRRELRRMQRRATGLLVAITAVYVVAVVAGPDQGWGEWVRAGAEASMVGGLADWFAVTALFRHPLGVPIPHTAVIRARKDQFGETLGSFVQDNFLTPDVVVARVRTARLAERASTWLTAPGNAESLSAQVAETLVGLADVVKDQDVHRVLEEELAHALDRVELARLGGRVLRAMTESGRHHELFTSILVGIEHTLEDNRESLRTRFGQESPWWLPDAAQDRIFDRLLDGFCAFLHDVNADPDHELRRRFDEWVASFTERLDTSPELAARADELKRELLAHPDLRRWTASLWTDLKAGLRVQAADSSSPLRARVADGLRAAGHRLRDDPELTRTADDLAERVVRLVAERFHDEIGSLVTATISRWDAAETSDKLELLLGRDLQFIRINGTVVGGIAGLAIHAVTTAVR